MDKKAFAILFVLILSVNRLCPEFVDSDVSASDEPAVLKPDPAPSVDEITAKQKEIADSQQHDSDDLQQQDDDSLLDVIDKDGSRSSKPIVKVAKAARTIKDSQAALDKLDENQGGGRLKRLKDDLLRTWHEKRIARAKSAIGDGVHHLESMLVTHESSSYELSDEEDAVIDSMDSIPPHLRDYLKGGRSLHELYARTNRLLVIFDKQIAAAEKSGNSVDKFVRDRKTAMSLRDDVAEEISRITRDAKALPFGTPGAEDGLLSEEEAQAIVELKNGTELKRRWGL